MDRNTIKIMVRDMARKLDDMERKAKSDALEKQQLRQRNEELERLLEQRNEELERELEQYRHGNVSDDQH